MSLNNTNEPNAPTNPPATKHRGLLDLPVELFEEIMSHVNHADINTMRRLNKNSYKQVQKSYLGKLLKEKPIQPTFYDMAQVLGMLQASAARLEEDVVVREVTELCLIADAPKMPEYGYDWCWQNIFWGGSAAIEPTNEDLMVIADANMMHHHITHFNNSFLHSGGYRRMLTAILDICPKLTVITVRKLEKDEHLRGWFDTEKFKNLSFYRPGLNTKDIYYGDWMYDSVMLTTTVFRDVYGEVIIHPNAGWQASFIDDLWDAVWTIPRHRKITVTFIEP